MNSTPSAFLASVRASLKSMHIKMSLRHRTVGRRIPARQLRLQAGLEDELSIRKARCVAKALSKDPNRRRLLIEFRWLKSLLVGNELERQVPLSREDYWQGILKVIAQQSNGCELQGAGAR